jgi:hypothetical protein
MKIHSFTCPLYGGAYNLPVNIARIAYHITGETTTGFLRLGTRLCRRVV